MDLPWWWDISVARAPRLHHTNRRLAPGPCFCWIHGRSARRLGPVAFDCFFFLSWSLGAHPSLTNSELKKKSSRAKSYDERMGFNKSKATGVGKDLVTNGSRTSALYAEARVRAGLVDQMPQ